MKIAHASHDRKIKSFEKKMMKDKEKLAKLRRSRPLEPIADYALHFSDGRHVYLSELFGDKKELILVHNMGTHCPYCTLWADGFTGLLPHLENRAAFVLESPDKPATQSKFAKKRGWKFKIVSSNGTTFRRDLGYADKEGNPAPGISTFVKKAGKIYRAAHTMLGPGDNFCVMWDLHWMLPKSDWQPRYFYR